MRQASAPCPRCNQPYIRIANLINPIRTIYVHEEKGKHREPTNFCMASIHRSIKDVAQECTNTNNRFIGQHPIPQVALRTISLDNKKRDVIISNQTPTDTRGRKGVKFKIDYESYKLSEEENKMPFVGFDIEELKAKFPSTFGVGRASKPSVAVMDNGRIQFSTEVSKAFDGCKVVQPSFNKDNLQLRFDGFAETPKGKETKVFELVRASATKKDGTPAKGKNKTVALTGSLILKAVGYDYKAASNQTYDVVKFDLDKHVVIFALPATLPTPKPKVARKPKKVATTNSGVNGLAVMPPPAPPNDDVVVEE